MTDDTKSMRYMVYISFHKDEDTIRYSFASHLSASLRRKGLISSASSFVDNSSKETYKTEQQKFKAFVVVFSEKYMLSSECLDELADIVDSQRNKENVVVPVFYGITQTEFVHKSRLDILRDTFPMESYSAEQVDRWIGALRKTTESYKPRIDYDDCELVEEIARDVYEKMFPTKRIGIYSRLLEFENFLCKQPWGLRSIGIWGMPGIGKTTLAEAVFDQFSGDYDASYFIKDFDKEFLIGGINHLLKENLGETLKEDLDMNNYVMKPEPKTVLIVLDNVCKPLDADAFLNGFDWFGPGSLIIITSRDKQVFMQCGVNQIYEIQGFNEDEAKQLFTRCLFGIEWREKSGLETLEPYLMSVIQYSSGNPLALSLYGKMLSQHKKPKEIETYFFRPKKTPPSLIMEAFKISYYTLNDNEKTMFLDIACFFKGENVDYVMQLFEGCGFFPHVGIYVLVEKCLVTILESKIQMHDLIQVIAKEISNEESVQLERNCRLWDASIIQTLLEDKETKSIGEYKGVEDIEAIFLDISNLDFFVKPNAFKSMHNLRLLKIYSSNPEKHRGLRMHKALEFLPNELRLLHWEDYPLQYMPHDFDPRHLVELNMPYSKLQTLWGGTKNLKMLKTIKLCHSQELVEIKDFLNAQNIEVIDLQGCTKFQSFPATDHLQHLRVINLSGCVEIKKFPEVPPNIEALYLSGTGIREMVTSCNRLSPQCRNCRELVKVRSSNQELDKLVCLNFKDCLHVQSLDLLRVLDLSGCSELEYIQYFPRNLRELHLSKTAIREMPPSISHLTALEILDLTNCKRLQHLPMEMSNLTCLVKLMLTGCSKLEDVTDFPTKLKELYLAETAIREVPSSICHLTELVKLDAENCKKLQDLPMGMGNLNSLAMLTLSGCLELEEIHDLPRNLRTLNLAEIPIRKMPSSFEDLTELSSLDLNHCNRLQHLQFGFFKSVVRVELSGCSDLEYIMGFSLQDMGQLHIDGTDKVMLCGPPPCNVTLIWENWRTFHVMPRKKNGSKCFLKLTPFLATPYQSKLPSSLFSSLVSSMYALVSLFLSNAYILNIPQEICYFPSLRTLDLCGNGFSKLPKSMKQLYNLESLILCHCKNLISLPELPQSLELLNAHGCVSLKNIHRSFEQFPRYCAFSNCFNLSSDSVKKILETSVAHMAREPNQKHIKAPEFSFSVPAFTGLNSIFHLRRSSSVKIQLTPTIKTLLGFRISVVIAFWDDSYSAAGLGIRCVCRWKNKKGLSRRLERIFYCWTPEEVVQRVRKNHMFVFCDISMRPGTADGNDFDILDDLVVFEFVPVNGQNMFLDSYCTITECGVDVITAKTEKASHDLRRPGFVLDSMELSSSVLPPYKKRKRSFSGSEDIEMEHGRLILSETKKRVAADMVSLSSSSMSHRPRYHVFLSFYEDVRRTFVSYLIKEFKWIGITAVCSGLMNGQSMSHPEVTQAIKESSISVVILSKKYVSSSKCLNELVEILTWKEETWGYRVIPIYYEMDPSDVRKQTKDIRKDLVGTFLGKVEKPEMRWMRALAYIVDIVGESYQDWDDDMKMIEKIAIDVSNQVDVRESNGFDVMFVFEERKKIEKLEKNFWDKLNGVHITPTWYMYTFYLIYLCLLTLRSRILL